MVYNPSGTGRFNMPLYKLRESHKMSQEDFGKYLGGWTGHTVMRIENGCSGGRLDFWMAVQKAFKIPDADMWSLQLGIDNTIIEGGKEDE